MRSRIRYALGIAVGFVVAFGFLAYFNEPVGPPFFLLIAAAILAIGWLVSRDATGQGFEYPGAIGVLFGVLALLAMVPAVLGLLVYHHVTTE